MVLVEDSSGIPASALGSCSRQQLIISCFTLKGNGTGMSLRDMVHAVIVLFSVVRKGLPYTTLDCDRIWLTQGFLPTSLTMPT